MTYPPATRGMTSRPTPIPDPDHPSELEICSRCGCRWRLSSEGEQPKDEWCAEPRDGSCQCHSHWYVAGYNAEQRRNPVIVEGEEVIGFITPLDGAA